MTEFIKGRYQLGEKVAQGAMGTVYTATDGNTGKIVALKRLRDDATVFKGRVLERFEREAEALRILNHPNIVAIHGTIQENGDHYIVMDYISGGDLRTLIAENGALPIDKALTIALELSDALARAHHLRIIHRDIKPANILIAEDGSPRLTDFGVAHIEADKDSITEDGAVVGTYAYLSPESVLGEELDARADIWSFGVVLYEMLTGERPFEDESVGRLMIALLNGSPADIQKKRPGIPVALADLIYRMLTRNREERIPSMRMVGAQIEAIIRSLDTDEINRNKILQQVAALGDAATRFDTPDSDATLPAEVGRVLYRNNLPPQTTPFVGREDELAHITSVLGTPECRLITLMGPGGMGKTRLSIEAAQRMLRTYSDGVYFVPLAPIESPEFIAPTIAESIDFSFHALGDEEGQLLEHLSNKSMLLVVDNFEHVIEGAPFINNMLTAAPNVTIMATSRERLNMPVECLVELSGMTVPENADSEVFEEIEAVQMFIAYARRASPGYELAAEDREAVARICSLVEGLPLALELAASWVRMLSPQELADELATDLDFLTTNMRDVPERHRSLRAVFDYSWKLLDEAERDAFMQLSVFCGGFTREAAQAVTGASLRTLLTLTDKSLIRREPSGRYQVHDMLREYAGRTLAENNELNEKSLNAHRDYYTTLAINKLSYIFSADLASNHLEIITQELDNLRAAWRRIVTHSDDVETLMKFAKTMHLYFDTVSRFREAIETYKYAYEAKPDGHILARTTGKIYHGWYEWRMDHHEKGKVLMEEALTLLKKADDFPDWVEHYQGFTLRGLGNIALSGAEPLMAERYYMEAKEYAEEDPISRNISMSSLNNNLGIIAIIKGDYEKAVEYYTNTLDYLRGSNARRGQAYSHHNIGNAYSNMEQKEKAEEHFRIALDLWRSIDSQSGEATTLMSLGYIEFDRGNYDEAERLFKISQEIANRVGTNELAGSRYVPLIQVALRRGETEKARNLIRKDIQGANLETNTQAMVQLLFVTAELRATEGDHTKAMTLVHSFYQAPQVSAPMRAQLDKALIRYSAEMTDEQVEEAMAAGEGLQRSDLIAILEKV